MNKYNKKNRAFFFVACIFIFSLFTRSINAKNSTEIEDILALLAEQNKILQQQKQTIENIQLQNAKLRKVIEKSSKYIASTENIEHIPLQIFVDQVPLEPEWKFSFIPRTALRFNTFHGISINKGSYIEVVDEPQYWMNGATFSATTPWLPDTSFLLTGLYGSDKGTTSIITTQPISSSKLPLAFPVQATFDSEFYDFEFIARTQIPETNANWFIGIEYQALRFEGSIFSGPPIFDGRTKRSTEVDVWNLGVGLGGFFNLSEDETHRIFSNARIFGSNTKVHSSLGNRISWWGAGIGINLGYEWIINQSFSVSPRYRGQFAYAIRESTSLNDQFFIFHGPELHLVFRF